jgi:hypothetical protein
MNELIFIAYVVSLLVSLLIAMRMGSVALSSLVVTLWVIANLFVQKQIDLFGFSVTAADALVVGAMLGVNLLQEFYGKDVARKTIWASFFVLCVYVVLSMLHCAYVPNQFDTTQAMFMRLLYPMPRLVVASLLAYLVAANVEYYLYGFLKTMTNGRFFVFRNYATVTVSQFIDTLLFSFIGLYGIVGNFFHVVMFSYMIKLGIVLFAAPILSYARYLKRGN